jgi:uncharacterized protein (TIGR02246 family)
MVDTGSDTMRFLRNSVAPILAVGTLLGWVAACVASPAEQGTLTVAALVPAWVEAWNRHDAASLASLLTPNVTFVLVNGRDLHGREDFEKVHRDQFADRYDKSLFAIDGAVQAADIRPDVVLVNWRWTISGVRNPDGSPAGDYHGIFTWVALRQGKVWQIRAAQNTVDR